MDASKIVYGQNSYQVARASVTLTADGELIAASTGFKIILLSAYFAAIAVADVTFKSGGVGGTALSPALVPPTASSPWYWNWNPHGWFITDTSQNLYADLTTPTSFKAVMTYAYVA